MADNAEKDKKDNSFMMKLATALFDDDLIIPGTERKYCD